MSAIGYITAAEREEIRKLREVSEAHPRYIYKVTATTNTSTSTFERRIVATDAIQAIRIAQKTWTWCHLNVTAVVLESAAPVWGA